MKYTHTIAVQPAKPNAERPKPVMVDLNITTEEEGFASVTFVASDAHKDKWPSRVADRFSEAHRTFWLKEAPKLIAEVNKALA